jgi:hypothetical protein
MILFNEKYNVKEMIKGAMPANLIATIKPEVIKNSREIVDNVKSELERYLFQNMMEGEQKNDKIVSKTVENM